MRDIKFRAWDKGLGKWLDCVGVNNDRSVDIRLHLLDRINRPMYKYMTVSGQDIFIMQYTGLKDKNGKEIYEGDICNVDVWLQPDVNKHAILSWSTIISVEHEGSRYIFHNQYTGMGISHDVQHWTGYSYSVKEGEKEYHCMVSPNGVEVIGNIYENPDLLESAREDK